MTEVHKRRLHLVAAVVAGLKAIRRLLPVLIIAVLSGREPGATWPLILAAAVVPFSLAVGILRWWRYRYWIDGGELRIEQGILVRRRLFIPTEHVQAIDVTAGIVQRAFGLVRVQIKTAAAGNQAELSAVTKVEAEQLRAELSRAAPAETVAPSEQVTRHAMTPRQLIWAASTSGQLGVILSGILWIYSKIDDLVEEQLVQFLEDAPIAESLARSSPVLIVVLIALGLLIAWLLSVVGAVLRYGGFSVERRGEQLIIRRGIIERREMAIRRERIQAIRIVETLPRQPFGYGAIFVESAGHAEEKGRSTYLHPCLHRDEWQPFLQDLVPELAATPVMQSPPPRARIRFVLKPLLLSALLAAAAALALPYGWLAAVLAIPLLAIAWLSHRDTGVGTTAEIAVLRSRAATCETMIVPRRRIQFAATAQSLLQRRRQLASVEIGAASGARGRRFSAGDLDQDAAADFLTWCLPRARPGGAVLQVEDSDSEGL